MNLTEKQLEDFHFRVSLCRFCNMDDICWTVEVTVAPQLNLKCIYDT